MFMNEALRSIVFTGRTTHVDQSFPHKQVIFSLSNQRGETIPTPPIRWRPLVWKSDVLSSTGIMYFFGPRTKKVDHIAPFIRTFNWFPVSHIIDFKILLLAFKALNGFGTKYIFDLLLRYQQVQGCFQSLESKPKDRTSVV